MPFNAIDILMTLRDPAVVIRGDTIASLNNAAQSFGWRVNDKTPEALKTAAAGDSGTFFTAAPGGTEYAVTALPYDDCVVYTLIPSGESGDSMRVISSVAESLRDLLSVLMLSANHILPVIENLGESQALRHSAILNRELFRLRRLTNHLDAFTETRASEPVRKALFDLVEMCAETTESIRQLAGAERTISFRSSERDILFYGEKQALRRMLLVLADNALSHAGEGAEIRVSVNLEKERAVISVSDNGAGISREALGSVFGKAFTERASNDAGGAGFGLTYANSAAKRHGGTVTVLSRPGEGTTVAVSLPVSNVSASLGLRSTVHEYSSGTDVLVELSDVLPPDKYSQKYMD